MKKLILAVLLTIIPSFSFASGTNFVRLSGNKATYSVGDRAVLMAYLQILPTGNDETFMAAKISGSAVKINNFATREWVTLTAPLSASGTEDWEVSVYLQDKTVAAELQSTIAFYSDEILQSQQKLNDETDTDKRAILQQIIDRDTVILNNANTQLGQIRRLVEVQHFTITVHTAMNVFESPLATDPLTLTLDRSPANYPVNTRATLLTHVNKAYTSPDGATENVVSVNLDASTVETAILGAKDFSTVSPAFVLANIGSHIFHVTLLIRSKSESDSLRNSLGEAVTRRDSWQTQFDASSDPLQKAYIQHQIDDLNAVITGLNAQLMNILSPASTKDISFTVTN